jgi:Fe(3+) dicitrate transport protein
MRSDATARRFSSHVDHHGSRRRLRCAILGCCALLAPLAIPAAAATASPPGAAPSLGGQLRSSGGAALAGATVVLEQRDRRLAETRADDQGRFTFAALDPGHYVVLVLAAGTQAIGAAEVVEVGTAPVTVELTVPVIVDEIAVFGTRIATAPEKIPGAVTVLSRELIEASRPTHLGELLRKAPGVMVRDEEGFSLRPNIGMRGLNPTRSSKVLLLEDGLPLTYAPYGDNASYYHPPLQRFESIEILKGSGQIAYGPATVGGVINYLTPAPPARQETRFGITAGNRNYLDAHLSWGGTWGNTGVLVDLMRKQGDGARENLHSELDDVNAKVVHTFSDRQSLSLRLNYYGEESNVTYSGLTESEWAADPRQNPFANDFFYGDRYGASLVHRLRLGDDVQLATSLYGSQFTRHWWRQSSNSGQRPNDAADPACGGMANLDTTCGNEGKLREYRTWGVEPRLQWDRPLFGRANELQVGVRAHFEEQERLQRNGDTPTSRTGRVVEDNARDNQAFSMFAQDRLTLGRWTVSPGVRVERIYYERTNRLANGGAGALGDTSLTQVVPGLGVAYTTDTATVFAGVHRGFAPPRTEDILNNSGGVVELDPELSWNSELGVRLAPRSGVHLEATLFRMDYENQIVPASVAGGVGATLTNAGETLHQGIELGARVDSAPAFGTAHNVYGTLAYTWVADAAYRGERFSNVSGFSHVSITGNRLPYAPEHLLAAGLGYRLPLGVDVFVEAVHVGEQFGDDLNTVAPTANGQRGLIPDHTVWNATLSYELPRFRTTLFTAVKNLTDELYIVDRTRGVVPGSPRLVQFGLSFRH